MAIKTWWRVRETDSVRDVELRPTRCFLNQVKEFRVSWIDDVFSTQWSMAVPMNHQKWQLVQGADTTAIVLDASENHPDSIEPGVRAIPHAKAI